jgi:hypothetical protein
VSYFRQLARELVISTYKILWLLGIFCKICISL